jgi:hypothetical protein
MVERLPDNAHTCFPFRFRILKTVECIVTVDAMSQADADRRVRDQSNWADEYDVDMPHWEVLGPA